ncbi:MAG TPA: hypothetical protein VJ437_05005 [Acidiferrobacterales bacterium]|nr:hypothetical protein [Acidiferrobacterales bacterium]
MNKFENFSLPRMCSLPRMWMSPNAVFQYRDTALEAAYLEIGRLQNTNTLQRQLLDAATTRISDLAQYQGKAANIIARLKGQNPCLKEARAA